VMEAEGASKSFDGRPIVANLSLRVMRGDRLGIIGPNGAGKTTLINLLTGQLEPDSGMMRLGSQVVMATLDQRRATLAPTTTLVDALTGGGSDYVDVNGEKKHVIGYMKDFLFAPEQARTPIGKLSGGERGRLMLARALAIASNVLVLDEPTNDLDIETLDLLQELLSEYPGTILLVSHDRDFLDRVATSVLVADGEGRWIEYAGGYSDMLAQRRDAAPPLPAAARPKATASASAAPKPAARKLSFKDKHALETLPNRITALEQDISRLNAVLADPTLYARQPAKFAEATQAFEAAQGALAAAEEEWLRLEMLREDIEGG